MLRYKEIIDRMTVRQKIDLLTDIGCLAKEEFHALGIPNTSLDSVSARLLSDGAGLSPSVLARSWNAGLVERVTTRLAARASQEGVSMLVTPSPKPKLDGYSSALSEDPCLSSELAGAFLRAVHGGGVLACLSELYLTEGDLDTLDAEKNRRILQEYFIKPFQHAVKQGGCESVMTTVCGPGGAYGHLNRELLLAAETNLFERQMTVLCREHSLEATVEVWHAGGIVLEGVASVLELAYEQYLQLTQSIEEGHATIEELEDAFAEGSAISEEMMDAAVDRVIAFAFSCRHKESNLPPVTDEEWHKTQALAAEESVVLLKNDPVVLPIRSGTVALIGDIAMTEHREGRTCFAEQVAAALSKTCVGMARGYVLEEDRNEELLEEAKRLAQNAQRVIVFLGTDASRTRRMTEGRHLQLPANQLALLDALRDYQSKLICVLSTDLCVDMSFDESVSGLVLAPIGGSACAQALGRILSGEINPSGRLTETYFGDTDRFLWEQAQYKTAGRNRVGPFFGYRYAESTHSPCRYPFGHGLSYTQFAYSNLRIEGQTVCFSVENRGEMCGKETVQVYVGKKDSALIRPDKELKAFGKIELQPHERRDVRINGLDLKIFDEQGGVWVVEQGCYEIYVGPSASVTPLHGKMTVEGSTVECGASQAPRRSEYLQSESNILSDDYTLEAGYKKMKRSWKWKILSILALLVAVAIDGCLAILAQPFDGGMIALNVVLVLVAAALFAVDRAKGKERRRKIAAEERTRANELFASADQTDPKRIEELFVSEFEFAGTKGAGKGQETAVEDFSAWIDPDMTLASACEELVAFAAERGVQLTRESASSLLAAMASSRLLIMPACPGERARQIWQILTDFLGASFVAEAVAPGYLDGGNLLSFTDGDGTCRDTGVLNAIRIAQAKKEQISVSMLTDVKAADMATLFASYIRYFNNPNRLCRVNEKKSDTSYVLPENLWFVAVPAEGETLDAMPAYLCELATALQVDYVDCAVSEERGIYKPVTYHQLVFLADGSRNGFVMDEGLWKKVDRLEQYVNQRTPYHISNKLWLRMERYLAVFCACGHEMAVALDHAMAQNLVPVLLPTVKGKLSEEDRGLLETVESYFGEDTVPMCRKIIKGNESAPVERRDEQHVETVD